MTTEYDAAPALSDEARRLIDLEPNLLSALREIARYARQQPTMLYWWRRASMAKLADMGLVETWRPLSCRNARRTTLPYRMTKAGHALAVQEKPHVQP